MMRFQRLTTRLLVCPHIVQICGVLRSEQLHVSSSVGKVDRPAELDDYPGKDLNESAIKIKGKIYDKKPFKFRCVKGKAYKWCACGLSKNQPFCDGSHNGPLMKSVLRPVTFIAPEDKDYWFCNCKQTDHRPLCDGTHKDPKIQEAIKS